MGELFLNKDLTKYVSFFKKSGQAKQHYRMKRVSEYISEFDKAVLVDSNWLEFEHYPINCQTSLANQMILHESNDLYVDEGLLTTYPVKFAYKDFREYCKTHLDAELCNLTVSDVNVKHDNDMKIIDYEDELSADELNKPVKTFTVKFPFYEDELSKLETFIKGLSDAFYRDGYFYVNFNKYKVAVQPFKKPIVIISALFEAKYNELKFDFADTLYHVFPIRLLDKIRKNGLVAKGNNNFNDDFNYPDRTYLFNGASEAQIIDFMMHKAKHEVSNTYCICKVDGKALKNSNLQFYSDPMCIDDSNALAIFTYEVIPLKMLANQILLLKLNKLHTKIISKKVIDLRKD